VTRFCAHREVFLFATENKLIRRKGSHVVMGRMGMKVNETIPEGSNSGDSDSNDVPWTRTQTMAESYTAVHPNRARMKAKISMLAANNTKCPAGEDEGLGESIDQGSDKSENSITTTVKSAGGTPPVGGSHREVSHRESDDEEDEEDETTEGENAVTPDEIMLSPASLPGGVEVHAGDAWSREAEVSNPVAVECNNTEHKQGVKKTVSFSTD